MDYREQQRFLTGSRFWGLLLLAVVFSFAALCAKIGDKHSAPAIVIEVLLTIALGAFLYYAPDYLHLTTSREKGPRWAIKIRWRLICAALLFTPALSVHERAIVAIAVIYFLICNWLARKVPVQFVWLYFWIAELMLLTPLLVTGQMGLAMGGLLLACSTHLAIVVSERPVWVGAIVAAGALIIIHISRWHLALTSNRALAASGLVLAVSASTVLLVHRAERQNRHNIEVAVHELTSFTGYPIQRIRELWTISNQQLAENWRRANIDEKDAERMAEWYRANSELYLFALSAYNVEYKRIRSNLNVLRLASGSCLDYGAGNGEVLLELAKRGHRVAYYDVEGQTMRFARHRAATRRLNIEFFCSKKDLAAAAAEHRGFDTIFSLDVLEHLPDLKGELNFLSSLLNPGGLLVFDVPAGATKAHPMHLNHELDVVQFLQNKGMRDERNLWKKLPFKKEEKYFFRATHAQPVGAVAE